MNPAAITNAGLSYFPTKSSLIIESSPATEKESNRRTNFVSG
jgi:hypothetical protein